MDLDPFKIFSTAAILLFGVGALAGFYRKSATILCIGAVFGLLLKHFEAGIAIFGVLAVAVIISMLVASGRP